MFSLNNDMDEIIDGLYLGDIESAQNIQKLKELNIKKVLSLYMPPEPLYKESDGFNQKQCVVDDLCEQNIIQYFGECLKFIKGDEKILVHCAAGASRSATIVIAFLMWDKKMSYKDAYNFAKSKRSIVWPNPGFIEQLQLFEKILKENDYDIDKIKFNEIDWKPKEGGYYLF